MFTPIGATGTTTPTASRQKELQDMRHFWFSEIRRTFSVLAPALWACGAVFAQPAIDAALSDLGSASIDTRTEALYSLVRLSGQQAGTGGWVIALLNSNPKEAERIRTALISALERQGAEYQELIKGDKQMSEAFLNYWVDLTDTVAALDDPRAAKGLLWGLASGAPAAVGGLADMCPAVVHSIIHMANEPVVNWRGAPLNVRAQAINVLGHCLRRPQAKFSPESAAEIRRELMMAADDPDWNVRARAADALMPLRADPEVQAKLQALAGADPYISPANRTKEGGAKFVVREFAARALDPPASSLFYVRRTAQSRTCSVQQASAASAGQLFAGPYDRRAAQESMCVHYDRTGKDPSFCWLVEPPNACGGTPSKEAR